MWIRFLSDDIAYVPMQWAWMDPQMVLMSICVSVLTAMLALWCGKRAQGAPQTYLRLLYQANGTLALGLGIWAMHFIGMRAFAPCSEGGLSQWHTVMSTIPSLLASAIVMHTLSLPHLSWLRMLLSGLAMGLGVGTMHFWGMFASAPAREMGYDPWGLAVALSLGMGMAIFSLLVYGRMQSIRAATWKTVVLSGCIMGAATACLHYIAMDAIYLPMSSKVQGDSEDGSFSFLIVGTAVCLIVGLFLLALNIALRWHHLFTQIQRSEARLRAVVETAVDGIVMIEGDGRVCAFNPAAERLLGWRAQEVMGRNVSMLMPAPHQQAHDGYLQRYLLTGQANIIDSGREVQARHKNGELVDIRLAVGRVAQVDQPLFVGFLTDIRQRKCMEKSLLRSEEQHRTLISNMPGVVFRRTSDALWQPLFLSTQVLALTGWSAQALLEGAEVQMMGLILPEDAERLRQAVNQALDDGEAYRCEYRLLHRDGSIRWISESGQGVYDAQGHLLWLDGVLIDTRRSKRAMQSLKARWPRLIGPRRWLSTASKGRYFSRMTIFWPVLGMSERKSWGPLLKSLAGIFRLNRRSTSLCGSYCGKARTSV